MRRSARILDVPIDDAAASEIARRSRGTPRDRQPAAPARARLRPGPGRTARSRSTWLAPGSKLLEVDEHGFDEIDRKLLRTIIDKFGGGPVGLNTHRRRDQRREGRDRGHLRAVSDPDRISGSDAARPRRDGRAPAATSGSTRPGGIHDCGNDSTGTRRLRRGKRQRRARGRTTDDDRSLATYVPPRVLTQRRSREDGRHDATSGSCSAPASASATSSIRASPRPDLGKEAALAAIARAGLDPDDIGVIVVGHGDART